MGRGTSPASALLDRAARDAPESVVEAAAEAIAVGARRENAEFVARALRGVVGLVAKADPTALADAIAADTDEELLRRGLELLAKPERTPNLWAEALRRGRDRQREILAAEGGPYSAAQVAAHLGISRQAVDKRRRAGRLLGLTAARRGYAYPAWQFAPEGLLPGLPEVLTDLADHDPWMRALFLTAPNLRLDGDTPLAALRSGRLEAVRRAARTYGEHGAA